MAYKFIIRIVLYNSTLTAFPLSLWQIL